MPASFFFGLISKSYLILPICFDFSLTKLLFFRVLCCTETTRSLLILLCTWSYSIDGQVDYFLRLDNLDDFVSVDVDIVEDLLFTLRLWTILWMCTWMDNTVHVQVKIVDIWIVILYFLLHHLFLLPCTILYRSNTQGLVLLCLFIEVYLIWVRGLLILLLFFSEFLSIHFEVILCKCINDYFWVADC